MPKNLKVGIEFKPQDLWVGVYWKVVNLLYHPDCVFKSERVLDLWVCLIPTVPIHIEWRRKINPWQKKEKL